MNTEHIGKFIHELRKEKELTQEQLADLIPIGRGAVSKWERGVTIPDSSTLLRLSDIFDVTINEILVGSRLSKKEENSIVNKITLKLYDSNNKRKKIISILLLTIFAILILFLIYYFIMSYKSIKVYTITGIKDSIKYFDGIFVETKNKIYFRIDDTVSDDSIEHLTLYYQDENNGKVVIYSSDNNYINFIDYYGYDSYFDFTKINYIIANLYLEANYNNGNTDNIKLWLTEDYINDNLFKINYKEVVNNNFDVNEVKNTDSSILVEKIKEKFTLQNDNYIFEYKDKNSVLTYSYMQLLNNLYLTRINLRIIEEWSLNLSNKELTYTQYNNDNEAIFSFTYLNSIKCTFGSCQNEKEKIDDFWHNTYELLIK